MWPSVWIFRHGPFTGGTSVFATSWKSCGPYRLTSHLTGLPHQLTRGWAVLVRDWHLLNMFTNQPSFFNHYHLTPIRPWSFFRAWTYSQIPFSQIRSECERGEKGLERRFLEIGIFPTAFEWSTSHLKASWYRCCAQHSWFRNCVHKTATFSGCLQ